MKQNDSGGVLLEERVPRRMDASSVLYHPHFEPDLATLRRALLVSETVRSIVPRSARFKPSVALFKHMEILPDTFIPTRPKREDANIASDYYVLAALKKAFAQLSKDARARQLPGKYTINRRNWSERLAVNGATLLNTEKLTHVVHDSLRENGLIYADYDDDNFLVDERAANLIVSYLAQRMSYRLAVRTLAGVEDSYLLSTACDVYDRFIPDKEALFASAVLRLHFPADIGAMDHRNYAELRARYGDLRESFPVYFEQLQRLYLVRELDSVRDVLHALRKLGDKLASDTERIKSSTLGGSIRKWVPGGLACALTAGAALLTGHSELALGGVGFQLIALLMDRKPMYGQFDGVRSVMMSANKEISRAARLPDFLGDDLLRYMRAGDR